MYQLILIASRDPTSPSANQEPATSNQNHPQKIKYYNAQQGIAASKQKYHNIDDQIKSASRKIWESSYDIHAISFQDPPNPDPWNGSQGVFQRGDKKR